MPDPSSQQVRPLRGDPAPPEIADISTRPVAPIFTFPPSERRLVPESIDRLPTVIGDPNGDPGGRPHWGGPPVTVFPPDQLDSLPRAKVQVAPDYPVSLRQSGAEGTVLVEFDVDATGRVNSARVLRSTEHGFEEATLRAVLKWRFEPGRRNGRAVPFRMSIPVDFRLGAD